MFCRFFNTTPQQMNIEVYYLSGKFFHKNDYIRITDINFFLIYSLNQAVTMMNQLPFLDEKAELALFLFACKH